MWPPSTPSSHLDTALALLTLGTPSAAAWDAEVQRLFSSPPAAKLLEAVYNVDKSLATLKQLLHLAVVLLVQSGSAQLDLSHLKAAQASCVHLESSNPLADQILDLPILELCLLIAIKHLSQIYDGEPFNFEMVYHEYVKFKRRKMPSLTDERSVVSKSWETLLLLELVQPKGGRAGTGDDFSLHLPAVPAHPDVLASAVERHPNCPTEVAQWLASSHHVASH